MLMMGTFAIAKPSENVVVESDNILYEDTNNNVVLSGNVIVVHKNITLTSNLSYFDTKKDTIRIPHQFTYRNSQQVIVGDTFQYDFSQEKGFANKIDMKVNGSFIKGEKVVIQQDKIEVFNAYQTICDRKKPCHHINAKKITIYPEWNTIVADDTLFYVYTIPIMWIPNYVIKPTDSSFSSGISNAIPRFGRNEVEGGFVKWGLSYYINEKIQGTMDIQYLSNLSGRYGISNMYLIDQRNSGEIRAHHLLGKNRLEFGWKHKYLLGVPYKDKNQVIDDFFKGILPPSNDSYPEIIIDYTYKELVNYQWLSLQPQLTLMTPEYTIFETAIKNSFVASIADIEEETVPSENINHYTKNYFQYKAYRPFNEFIYGSFTPGLTYMKSGYSLRNQQITSWKRFYYTTSYDIALYNINFGLDYKNTFSEDGSSPFLFDSFNISTKEEVSYTLYYDFWDGWRLSYHQDDSISDKLTRNRDYGIHMLWCHWKLGLYWYDTQKRFLFNISL